MISKIIFLLSLSAALSFHLQFTPDALKSFFETMYNDLTIYKGQEFEKTIQANLDFLASTHDEFYHSTNEDFKEAAKPFWDFVQSAEEDAESKGQDISKCIDLADEKLFNLNETYGLPLFSNLTYWLNIGSSTINRAAEEAHSNIEEVISLRSDVYDCNDDECATELEKILSESYLRALNTLSDAVVEANNFVQTYIPTILSLDKLNKLAYQQEAAEIIDDAKNCINNL